MRSLLVASTDPFTGIYLGLVSEASEASVFSWHRVALDDGLEILVNLPEADADLRFGDRVEIRGECFQQPGLPQIDYYSISVDS